MSEPIVFQIQDFISRLKKADISSRGVGYLLAPEQWDELMDHLVHIQAPGFGPPLDRRRLRHIVYRGLDILKREHQTPVAGFAVMEKVLRQFRYELQALASSPTIEVATHGQVLERVVRALDRSLEALP